MFERILHRLISEELEVLKDDYAIVERHLRHRGLDTMELAAVRQFFETKTPKVIHGYPRSDGDMPCFAVILGSEGSAQEFLNAAGHTLDADFAAALNDASAEGLEQFAQITSKEFHVWVCAAHSPDPVLYFYEILKLILYRRRNELLGEGMLAGTMSGADVAPDGVYLPAHLFIRRLSFTVLIEEPFLTAPPPFIREVTGVHIDDGTVSGVVAHVVPYAVEDEDDE